MPPRRLGANRRRAHEVRGAIPRAVDRANRCLRDGGVRLPPREPEEERELDEHERREHERRDPVREDRERDRDRERRGRDSEEQRRRRDAEVARHRDGDLDRRRRRLVRRQRLRLRDVLVVLRHRADPSACSAAAARRRYVPTSSR